MTWTASYSQDPGQAPVFTPGDRLRVQVSVVYTDGTTLETIVHNVESPEQLLAQVSNRLTRYARADAFLAAIAALAGQTITPTAPPTDPNAGLATLTVEGLMGALSEESRSRLMDKAGALPALREDVFLQNRDRLATWIALMVARPDPTNPASVGVITADEAAMLTAALSAPAQPPT